MSTDTDEILHGEVYCDLCEREGHTFRSCPQRDDDPAPDAHLEMEYESRFEIDGDWD